MNSLRTAVENAIRSINANTPEDSILRVVSADLQAALDESEADDE